MRFHYHMSSLIFASLSILHKSVVYPRFIYILCDECSDEVRGEYSSVKYTMKN